jgi:hypothetical protein
VLTITGHHLRLFHFDRSGAQYTPPLNFDDDPYIFVRLILGLSSTNETDISLDTSIQWRVENGRKVGGTLTTRAADNTDKVQRDTGSSASDAKGLFLLTGRFVATTIAPRWPKALLDVFSGFGSFLALFFEDRMNTRYMEPEEVLEMLRGMASNAEQHYDEIIRVFDAGIEALEKVENEDAALKVPPTDPVPPPVRSPLQRNPLKRTREEETEFQPAAKCCNLSVPGAAGTPTRSV